MGPVSSPVDDDLRPGRVLGPYELIVPVGSGGMANVWAARVRASGQVVALKMLRPQLAESPSFQEMFLDEALIASRVRHHNVCATFELGNFDGILTLVMEWVDGASLVRLLRPGPETDEKRPRIPLPLRTAARILADACAGLHAAHETIGDDGRPLAVVHRDVSPHNVLITTTGEIKMTDFGVAKALGKSHMTIAGQIKGKLAYMSPEQLMGGAVDRRSDVFALGCVLYEITTGERPFRGDNDPQVMAAIMMGAFEPPSAIVPGYPPDLDGIVVRALASDPDQRFPTAEHLRRALEHFLHTSGPPIEPRHVAALLHERLGPEIASREQTVAASLPPRPTPPRTTDSGSGAMEVDRGAPPRRAGTVGLVLAMLVGSALGLGVLGWVAATRKHPTPETRGGATSASAFPTAEAASASASAFPTAEAASASTPAFPTAEAASASAPAFPTAEAPGTVRLTLEPPTARIVAEGVELPPGTASVPRPVGGGSTTLIVRADGYEDTIVLLDRATPDDVEVSLVPVTTAAARREPRPAASASASAPAGSSAAGDAGVTGAVPEMPPNPYE